MRHTHVKFARGGKSMNYDVFLDSLNLLLELFEAYSEKKKQYENEKIEYERKNEEKYQISKQKNDEYYVERQKKEEEYLSHLREKVHFSRKNLKEQEERILEILRDAACLPKGTFKECFDAISREEPNSDTLFERLRKTPKEDWHKEKVILPGDNEELLKLCIEISEMHRNINNEINSLNEYINARQSEESENLSNMKKKNENESYIKRENGLKTILEKYEKKNLDLDKNLVEKIEQEISPESLQRKYVQARLSVPSFEHFNIQEKCEEGIQFGRLFFNMSDHYDYRLKGDILEKQFGDFLVNSANSRIFEIPYGRRFIDENFSSLIQYNSNTKAAAINFMRMMVLRLLVSVPCGEIHFTFIDPIDLGASFNIFKIDADTEHKIFEDRILTNESEIEERLSIMVSEAQNIIQRRLRSQDKNIFEYNKEAKKNKEPLRMLFVTDFPVGFSDSALHMLGTIINKGLKCGIYTILAGNENQLLLSPRISPELKEVYTYLNKINFMEDAYFLQEYPQFQFVPDKFPENRVVNKILKDLSVQLGNIREADVTIDEINNGLLQKERLWFRTSTKDSHGIDKGLDIPIGLEGAEHIVKLHLGGHFNSLNHALVVGLPDSGKSNFLHVVITNILLNYSPNDVQMYILDYKYGTEFKFYSDYDIKNFRVISTDSEPEFGKIILEHLNKEMKERSSRIMHTLGGGKIEDYYQYCDENHIPHKMPRLILIVDEYHKLLDNKENPVCKFCADMICELATKGSTYGIHMILSSQQIGLAKALDKLIYDLFSTRIGLECAPETAYAIFEQDAMITALLKHEMKFEAVFNENLGQSGFNRRCRMAHAVREDLDILLKRIGKKQKEYFEDDFMKPKLLFSRVEFDKENVLTRFAENGHLPKKSFGGVPLYIGESVAMKNSFYPVLRCSDKQNLLIVGAEENKVVIDCLCGFSCMSIIVNEIVNRGYIARKLFTVFDFLDNDDEDTLLGNLIKELPQLFHVVDRYELYGGLKTILEEMESQGDSGEYRHFMLFLGLCWSDELIMESFDYENSSKDLLGKLLQEGPSKGLNSIVWANNSQTFLSCFRGILPFFNYRFASQIDSKDAREIIGQEIPDNMREMNLIKYEKAGRRPWEKVRIYRNPLEKNEWSIDTADQNSWFEGFVSNVRKYIRK